MKTFFFVLASLVLAVSMAAHVPGHAGSPVGASATVNGKRALKIDLNGKGEQRELGVGGYRALRGVDDDLEYADAYPDEDDEVVVAGGAAVAGGAVVARPRGRRGFY